MDHRQPDPDRQTRYRKGVRIKGAKRIDLKRILKELEAEGHLTKRKKTFRDPDSLPPVSVLQVIGPDERRRSARQSDGVGGDRP